jgi:hypothetical protein
MSFWFPKRGKDGRWMLYSVSFPIQMAFLILLFFIMLSMCLVGIVVRLFRDAPP